MKTLKKKIGKKLYKKLWKKSDDSIEHVVRFNELYNNVPNDLKDVCIWETTFHIFPKKYKKKILKFLNNG